MCKYAISTLLSCAFHDVAPEPASTVFLAPPIAPGMASASVSQLGCKLNGGRD